MHALTLHKTLEQFHGWRILLASDAQQRCFLGARHGHNDGDDFMFVEIDRVTMLELERGMLDPHTAIAERGVGMTFEMPANTVAAQLHVTAG